LSPLPAALLKSNIPETVSVHPGIIPSGGLLIANSAAAAVEASASSDWGRISGLDINQTREQSQRSKRR
jgi:hypothetical protein